MSRDFDSLTSARAVALFASSLSFRRRPNKTEVEDAIRQAIRTYGGFRGCAGEMAAAYGERPEVAAPRMRWARAVVEALYLPPANVPGLQSPAHRADARANPVPVAGCSAQLESAHSPGRDPGQARRLTAEVG